MFRSISEVAIAARHRIAWAGIALAVASLASPGSASTYTLLIETDADAPSGSELFVQNYPSLSDLEGNTGAVGSPSALGISPGFSVGGLAYDGAYHLLLESDFALDSNGVEQVGQTSLLSFPTLSDLIANTNGSDPQSAFGVAPGFSVGGFLYDGGMYRVLFETDADFVVGTDANNQPIRAAGVSIVSYNSLDEMISGPPRPSVTSDFGVVEGFSVGGFFFDGAYNLLLESDTNATPTFVQRYLTFEDFIDDNGQGMFANFGIEAGASVHGVAYNPDLDLTPVPLPAGLALICTALLPFGLLRRRLGRAAARVG